MVALRLGVALSGTIAIAAACVAPSTAHRLSPGEPSSASTTTRDASGLAAELLGAYSRADHFYGETLTLKAESQFDYSDWCCVGDGAATGSWRVVGDCVEVTRVTGDGGLFLQSTRDDDVIKVDVVLLRIVRSATSIDLVNLHQEGPTADELRELNERLSSFGVPPLVAGQRMSRILTPSPRPTGGR